MGQQTDAGHKERLTREWIAAAACVVLAGLALRIAGFSLYDIGYSDELMQYLEQANRMVTGQGLVPWESREGLRNALIPQVLAPAVALGHHLAPGTLLHVALARGWFMVLTLIALPAAWRLGTLHSRAAGLAALTVAALWWESALFSQFMLSESLGAALMLAGAALLLDPAASRRALLGAGLLIGLAVLVRLQYAVFAAVLVPAALRLDRARWMPLIAGGAIAAVIGAASDLAAGLVPFSWALVTVKMNLGHGIAARFGTLPASAYLPMLAVHLFPFALPVGLGALFVGARYRPLLLAALANLLVHSLIAHKEYRFIWLTTFCLLVLTAIAAVQLAQHLAARKGQDGPLPLSRAALICAALALASFWSAHATGGAKAWRGGGAAAMLANEAARAPRTCAIALPYEYKSHLVPALLSRPRPLLLIPEGVMDGKAAMPGGILSGANVLLLRGDASPPGFRKVRCAQSETGFPCLFERAGSCSPDPVHGYQQVIAREGL